MNNKTIKINYDDFIALDFLRLHILANKKISLSKKALVGWLIKSMQKKLMEKGKS